MTEVQAVGADICTALDNGNATMTQKGLAAVLKLVTLFYSFDNKLLS